MTDAIFIVRQLQEIYLAKKKDLWMAFVYLEKAFDRVPREVVWLKLRYLGLDEWIVSVIKAMYEDASTKVRMNERESRAFNVKVGCIRSQFSAHCYSLPCWRHCLESSGKAMELLYVDDLVLIAEAKELLLEKVRKWKEGMEKKSLTVNAGKTKVMWCQVSKGQVEDSGEHPCGVCRKGVDDNSILCVECLRWVQKRCRGISA